MRTRIKYIKEGSTLRSNVLTNYEGKNFVILINTSNLFILQSLDCIYHVGHNDISKAKRLARSLLINKYNVRLGEEIRPR